MYRTLIPDVCYRNLFSWNTYPNNFSILCCLKDIVVEVTKKSPKLYYSAIVHDWLLQNRKALASLIWPSLFPELSVLKNIFFHQGSEGPQAFWLLTMSSFPSLQWKMYFFKTWNEFFPPAKLSVPWNEFLTANLILPSNTSSEQHRADSISCWSRWSIASEQHKNHVTQVMHSHCTVIWPGGTQTSDLHLARFI